MIKEKLSEVLFTPIKSIRWRYVPLLAIYFAFGASMFKGIAEAFWVKENLDLSAEALLAIGVWISLPFSIKMIFGQFADSIPLFGSIRRSYIFIAAILMVIGSLLLSGMAGEWPIVVSLGSKGTLYFIASLIITIGLVLQDVVADAMTVEVAEREGKTEKEIEKELKMIQLLGRLVLIIAVFLVAGLGGWLSQIWSYETIFLLTLAVPIISISGALFVKLEKTDIKPVNWKILGGGLSFACLVVAIGYNDIPYSQEIVFFTSLGIVIYLLRSVTMDMPKNVLKGIICASIVIFIYRAVPPVGPAVQWWQIDVLGFDKAFFGTLGQIGAGLTIAGMWFGAKFITEKPISLILTVLILISFVLNLPIIGMYYGLHEFTQEAFGFGARTIALIDTALASPFDQFSMVLLLSLVAMHAPRGNAATWFALMTSFMNLALTCSTLGSKYLNKIWVITREIKNEAGNITTEADYSQLGELLIVVQGIALVMPLLAIWFLMRPGKTN